MDATVSLWCVCPYMCVSVPACICMCVCATVFIPVHCALDLCLLPTEIQVGIDRAFMSLYMDLNYNRSVDLMVQTKDFPIVYQRQSRQTLQVCVCVCVSVCNAVQHVGRVGSWLN